MAKKAYVGVDNIARKVKNGYVGVRTAFPIYETQTTTENVTINSDALLSKYFTVTHDGYGFVWNSSYNQFRSSNSGFSSGIATTTLTALQDCTVTYTYNYGTENNYDTFTLTVKGSSIHSEISGVGTAKTRTDTLTKGQSIVFVYTKDGSVDENGDYVAFYNMSAAITTTKEVQVGTDYRNVARKIKKAYIGIGGVARPCWSNGVLVYYGEITSLGYGREGIGATSVGNYALFAGGVGTILVDTYNESLVKVDTPDLSGLRAFSFANNVGGYAFFAGGAREEDSPLYESKGLDAYDSSLTKTRLHSDIEFARCGASTIVGSCALLGGGIRGSYSISKVYSLDSSLSLKADLEELSVVRQDLASATINGYALFAGGRDRLHNSVKSKVDVYNSSLTKIDNVSDLSLARHRLSAATVGNHVLFAGGSTNGKIPTNDSQSVVDAYSTSLTRIEAPSLSVRRHRMGSTSLEDYAIFGGGLEVYTSNVVDAYDSSLTITSYECSHRLGYSVAATVKEFALFASCNGDKYVEAFTIK